MGMPVPAGTIRVYKNDTKGRVFFVGEDSVRHTPENEKINLTLGEAFDVTAEGKETANTKTGKNSWDASYELVFKNATENPVSVDYYQTFPNQWTISGSDIGKKETSTQNKWTVKIPAKGKTVLTYKVKLKGRD